MKGLELCSFPISTRRGERGGFDRHYLAPLSQRKVALGRKLSSGSASGVAHLFSIGCRRGSLNWRKGQNGIGGARRRKSSCLGLKPSG